MFDIVNIPTPMNRSLYFYEHVDQISTKKLTEDIIAINESDETLKKLCSVYNLDYNPKPINIYIDSFGGSVYQILGLLSVMEHSKTRIHTYATGAAMSCGLVMLIAGHKRFAYKYATLLYHQVSDSTWGKLEEMKEKLTETKRIDKLLETIILENTKLTKKKLREVKLNKSDWYITPKEALEWGIVDEIL